MPRISFGAGCFWGVEKLVRKHLPKARVHVGYQGGTTRNPTYETICGFEGTPGQRNHAEVAVLDFSETDYSIGLLVRFFLDIHDPTTKDRQGADVGQQYRSAIFCDKKKIEDVRNELTAAQASFTSDITTEILLNEDFPVYDAEAKHQDYFAKHMLTFCPHKYRAKLSKGDALGH